MNILILIISYLISVFLVFPYLDSFAYVKKNVLLHLLYGILTAYLHIVLGLSGLIINVIYLLVIYFSKQSASKNTQKNNSKMDDIFGHIVVANALKTYLIAYSVMYLLLNLFINQK